MKARNPLHYDGSHPRTPASPTGVGVLVLSNTLDDARAYVRENHPRLKHALVASPRSHARLRGFQFNRIEVAGPLRIEGELLRLVAVAGMWLY